MMEKIVGVGSWDTMTEKPAEIVKVSRRGLIGTDRQSIIKRAGHVFADRIDDLSFAPGDIPIHMLAIGATEGYGPNRNGDGFAEYDCERYHDRFVKQARFYKNHKNKNPKKSYGYVKLSSYNKPMRRVELLVVGNATKEAAERNGGLQLDERSIEILESGGDLPISMACFCDPTYPILTRDKGYVEIQDVAVGDYVWTHKGRWRKVTQLNRRPYTGEVFELSVNGLPFPLELTADHPMWAKVFAGSRTVGAIKAKASRYFTDAKAFEQEPAGWTFTRDLGVGDRLFYAPITRYSGYAEIDSVDLATVLGYYLAEGSFSYNNEKACTVDFSCHMQDSLPRVLPGIIERMFADVTIKISPRAHSVPGLSVKLFSTDFAEFLREYVGRGCKHKVIPPEIFNSSPEVKLAFLGAWLEGDGWADKKGIHWSTANRGLVLQGRDLLASLGLPASIYKIDHAKCDTSGKPGSCDEYTLNLAHLDSWALAEYSSKVAGYMPPNQSRTKPASMRICPDGLYALRIKNIASRCVSDQITYNFEVEEDESYSAAGLISHNCKVAFDVCSNCLNKAAHRGEYCTADTCISPSTGRRMPGCRDGLTKLGEDGMQQYVDNPDPQWFDISRVFNNADRIGFGNIADYVKRADAANRTPGGAELAEMYAAANGYDIELLTPSATMEHMEREEAVKIASILAVIEKQLSSGLTDSDSASVRALDSSTQSPMNFDEMGKIGSAKQAASLGVLASQKIVLPLNDFVRLLTGEDAEKSAAISAKVAPHLRGVYSRMAADPELREKLAASPIKVSQKLASVAQKTWAEKLAADYSLDSEAIRRRVERAAINAVPCPSVDATGEKQATTSGPENELACWYAAYKIAALAVMPTEPHETELTTRAVVLQNMVEPLLHGHETFRS